MRLFRRHRGSQSGNLAPVVTISVASDKDPEKIARDLVAVFTGRRLPGRLTARQVLAASLTRDEHGLADETDHVETLVEGILLDLQEAGLEIVQSDAEVWGRARPDRPEGW